MRLLAAVLGLTTLVSAQARLPESLLFTNVNVVDTRQGQVLHNMTVLIEQGRIRSIARYGLIAAGLGMRVVNASGKYLIPGLWDMHAHTAERRMLWDEEVIYPLYLANGVTAVRDMGGDPELLAERRQRLEQGELAGPHVFVEDHRSPPVGSGDNGQLESLQALSDPPRDSYVPIAGGTTSLSVPARAPELESSAALSAERSIEQLGGVLLACSSQEQVLREQRLSALAHHDLQTYSALRLQTIATYDPAKARKFFFQLSDHATWQVPTLVWSQTMAALDDPRFTADSRLAYVPRRAREQWDPKLLLHRLSPGEYASVKAEAVRDLELATAMHRTGVQFLAGTDAPDPYVIPGFSLHDELEWLVRVGFTATQALQSATLYPTLFMVKLDKYGVVEADHAADLVLLDSNPLEDIRNTRKIAAVIFSGKYYSRADLDKMLRQVREQAAKQ